MLRDTHPDLLTESPRPSPSAFRPGVHVCPWGAPGGFASVTLVSRERVLLAVVYCEPDEDTVESVKAHLTDLWATLEPAAVTPQLRLIG